MTELGAIWPRADWLLFGCVPAKADAHLACRSAVSDFKRTSAEDAWRELLLKRDGLGSNPRGRPWAQAPATKATAPACRGICFAEWKEDGRSPSRDLPRT